MIAGTGCARDRLDERERAGVGHSVQTRPVDRNHHEPDHAGSLAGERAGTRIRLIRERLDCVEYPPATVKKAVCGYGRADKAQVQRMVRALLRMDEDPRPDHASDALAVAICHVLHARPRRAREVVR